MGIITVPGLLSAKHPTTRTETPGPSSAVTSPRVEGAGLRTRPEHRAFSSAAGTSPRRGPDLMSGASPRAVGESCAMPTPHAVHALEGQPEATGADETAGGGVVVALTGLPSALRLAADGAVLLDLRAPSERAGSPVQHTVTVETCRLGEQADLSEPADRVDVVQATSARWVILLGGDHAQQQTVLRDLPHDCPVLLVVDC